MGESDRYREYSPKRRAGFNLGSAGNNLMSLFAILGVMYMLMLVIQVSYLFAGKKVIEFESDVLPFFAVSNYAEEFLKKPWTLLTYVFTDSQTEIVRFITNMIWLWGFGTLFQRMAGNKKLIPVFIYGGIVGGVVFVITCALQPNAINFPLMGANTGILALGAAATTTAPNFRFFKNLGRGIPVWTLFVIYLLIDLAGSSGHGKAHVAAHIGGAMAGYFFIVLLRKGWDGSEWMNNAYSKFTSFFDPYKSRNVVPARNRNFYDAGKRVPFKKEVIVTQEKVDEILDKINQKGYHFLTDDEKNILKRASEEGVR